MGLLDVVLTAAWLMLPAYFANSSAVFTGGRGVIDGGATLGGRRVLGDGKTWSGLVGGTAVGTGVGLLLQAARGPLVQGGTALPDYGPLPGLVLLPLSLALGALLGDVTASFVKRRRGHRRGEPWVGVDQLDFVVGAILLAGLTSTLLGNPWFTDSFTLPVLAAIVLLTPVLHLGANVAGHRMGKKEVPW